MAEAHLTPVDAVPSTIPPTDKIADPHHEAADSSSASSSASSSNSESSSSSSSDGSSSALNENQPTDHAEGNIGNGPGRLTLASGLSMLSNKEKSMQNLLLNTEDFSSRNFTGKGGSAKARQRRLLTEEPENYFVLHRGDTMDKPLVDKSHDDPSVTESNTPISRNVSVPDSVFLQQAGGSFRRIPSQRFLTKSSQYTHSLHATEQKLSPINKSRTQLSVATTFHKFLARFYPIVAGFLCGYAGLLWCILLSVVHNVLLTAEIVEQAQQSGLFAVIRALLLGSSIITTVCMLDRFDQDGNEAELAGESFFARARIAKLIVNGCLTSFLMAATFLFAFSFELIKDMPLLRSRINDTLHITDLIRPVNDIATNQSNFFNDSSFSTVSPVINGEKHELWYILLLIACPLVMLAWLSHVTRKNISF